MGWWGYGDGVVVIQGWWGSRGKWWGSRGGGGLECGGGLGW